MSDSRSYKRIGLGKIKLEKIDYGFEPSGGGIGEGLRDFCLEEKKKLVRKHGFASQSCCAAAMTNTGNVIFGNSQQLLYFEDGATHYKEDKVKVHAEKNCITKLINYLVQRTGSGTDASALIKAVYVELSPCPKCKEFLNAVLGNTPVYYSFDYESEMERWKKAAKVLCYSE
jgi:deoxycytidylate deaminase